MKNILCLMLVSSVGAFAFDGKKKLPFLNELKAYGGTYSHWSHAPSNPIDVPKDAFDKMEKERAEDAEYKYAFGCTPGADDFPIIGDKRRKASPGINPHKVPRRKSPIFVVPEVLRMQESAPVTTGITEQPDPTKPYFYHDSGKEDDCPCDCFSLVRNWLCGEKTKND